MEISTFRWTHLQLRMRRTRLQCSYLVYLMRLWAVEDTLPAAETDTLMEDRTPHRTHPTQPILPIRSFLDPMLQQHLPELAGMLLPYLRVVAAAVRVEGTACMDSLAGTYMGKPPPAEVLVVSLVPLLLVWSLLPLALTDPVRPRQDQQMTTKHWVLWVPFPPAADSRMAGTASCRRAKD
jgi:hypothetical protein